jgi:hypothetical protein
MRESDSLLILGNQYKTIHIDKGTNQKQVLPMAAMCLSNQENMKVIFWFSPGTPVSSTNKTDCHDIT